MSEHVSHTTYDLTLILSHEDFSAVRGILEKRGAVIVAVKEPQKLHLAFPIKKLRYGFLGVYTFIAAPETVGQISADLRLVGNVLREGIHRASQAVEPLEEASHLRRSPALKPVGEKTFAAEKTRSAPAPVLTNEELEKKIEEILK